MCWAKYVQPKIIIEKLLLFIRLHKSILSSPIDQLILSIVLRKKGWYKWTIICWSECVSVRACGTEIYFTPLSLLWKWFWCALRSIGSAMSANKYEIYRANIETAARICIDWICVNNIAFVQIFNILNALSTLCILPLNCFCIEHESMSTQVYFGSQIFQIKSNEVKRILFALIIVKFLK